MTKAEKAVIEAAMSLYEYDLLPAPRSPFMPKPGEWNVDKSFFLRKKQDKACAALLKEREKK